jgi:hypothetical protein
MEVSRDLPLRIAQADAPEPRCKMIRLVSEIVYMHGDQRYRFTTYMLSYHIPWKDGAKQYAGCMNLPIHEQEERATDFKRTADSVETVFFETLSLSYLLVDGIR